MKVFFEIETTHVVNGKFEFDSLRILSNKKE
jgi:hypothetical protein